MVSIFKLKRPCPCGSGKIYGDCCAPGSHHRKRVKNKEAIKEFESSNQIDEVGDAQDILPFQTLDKWVYRFGTYYNQSIDYLMEFDLPFIADIIREVEVEPTGQKLDKAQTLSAVSWLIHHRPGLIEEEDNEIRGVVEEIVGPEVASISEEMKMARFGAWEVERKGNSLQARALNGNPDSEFFPIHRVLDCRWETLQFRKNNKEQNPCFLGWCAQINGGPATILFFVDPLDRRLIQKAIDRSAWGTNNDFRTIDYEEDMMALLLNRRATDMGTKQGRVFFDPQFAVYTPSYLYSMQDWLDEELAEAGLFRDPEYDYFRSILLDVVRLEAWEEEDPHLIDRWLEDFYDMAIKHYGLDLHPALGRKTLRSLLGRSFIYRKYYGMPSSGKLKGENLKNWESFPVEVLDLDSAKLRAWAIPREWTLRQSHRWAEKNLSPEHLEEFAVARQRFREMLRLGAYLDCVVDKETGDLRIHFDMESLSSAIEEFFPARLLGKPLKSFPEEKKNTWSRIESGFRARGDFQEEDLITLEHLCKRGTFIGALPGVGKKTKESAFFSLIEYTANWPQSEGFHPHANNLSGEAAQAINEGLDELDDLF